MTLFVSRALQVADFGLSKSLVPVGKHDQIMDLNTTYKLTGETGSYRWVVMSVAHRKVGFRQGQSPPHSVPAGPCAPLKTLAGGVGVDLAKGFTPCHRCARLSVVVSTDTTAYKLYIHTLTHVCIQRNME